MYIGSGWVKGYETIFNQQKKSERDESSANK